MNRARTYVTIALMVGALGAALSAQKVQITGAGATFPFPIYSKWADAYTARIEVQDSGTGIPAEKLESIFEPFVTSKPDGLGMGLSICRSIIERHGGKLSATNNPDRGATFFINLPAAPASGNGQ